MKDEIFKLLNEKVTEIYLHFQNKLDIKYGDITPEQLIKQDEILLELTELINDVLIMEKKSGK